MLKPSMMIHCLGILPGRKSKSDSEHKLYTKSTQDNKYVCGMNFMSEFLSKASKTLSIKHIIYYSAEVKNVQIHSSYTS